jgi:hypothetical protein
MTDITSRRTGLQQSETKVEDDEGEAIRKRRQGGSSSYMYFSSQRMETGETEELNLCDSQLEGKGNYSALTSLMRRGDI